MRPSRANCCEDVHTRCSCVTVALALRCQVEEKRRELQEAEKAAEAAQARITNLRDTEKKRAAFAAMHLWRHLT